MKQQDLKLETRLIHSGEPRPRILGAVAMPVFQSSTFEYGGEDSYHDTRYIRFNNTPNHLALHEKLAEIENAEAALVTASGMAAIATSLLTVLRQGDHVLVQKSLYGGTHGLVTHDFENMGISYSFIDANDSASWKAQVRPNTRAIYVETISNPLVQIPDLPAVVCFAKEHGLVSLIDNTFASPINFRPPECGFDISLHSCSKYMNGHSDIVAGAVIGRAELVERIRHRLNHLGGTLDPHACFLLQRGMKTLALRVRHQNESARRIAEFLDAHRAVERVHYPGLESHPQHTIAVEMFEGFGGMLSFEIRGDVAAADRFMKSLAIPLIAPSLGGPETLITRPVTTSHAGLSAKEKERLGISDTLIRLSVGIEATEDLIADFKQALES